MSVTRISLDPETKTVQVIASCAEFTLTDGNGSFKSHGTEITFDATNRTLSINDSSKFVHEKDGSVLRIIVLPSIDDLEIPPFLENILSGGGRIIGLGRDVLDVFGIDDDVPGRRQRRGGGN